ncbi:MAG: sigma-70 family RNA polymerase sigma factor [Planctomycetota bacterium]|nr:sigma-70 family RNA polymerase sigma factor [Planctomycetota bacterium]
MASESEEPPAGRVLTRPELEELLQRHLAPLRSYVRLRSGPALRQMEPPSDVLQSALREIVERAASFRFTNELAFRRWILTIALHKIVSKTRYHGAARRGSGRAEDIASRLSQVPARDPGSHAGSPSRDAVHAEDLERLQAALDRLDDEDREIVCLRRIFDVPTSEIAEIVGLAESTVRWRLAQAMTRLASELD